jgi:hypothetical protein
MCSVDGCDRPVNRDGLCFPHKIKTVKMSTAQITREREGEGPGLADEGTASYVRKMFEDRRANGLPDPEPENSKAAAFAPAKGVIR